MNDSLMGSGQRTYVFQNRFTWRCMNPEWTPCYDSHPIQSHPFHFLRCRGRSQPEDKKETIYSLVFTYHSQIVFSLATTFLFTNSLRISSHVEALEIRSQCFSLLREYFHNIHSKYIHIYLGHFSRG